MNYSIENRDTVPMHFSCGGHTAYACPLSETIKLSDNVIEFPAPLDLKAHTLGISGLLTPHTRTIESHQAILTLFNTLFNKDALIFSTIDCD